MNLKSSFDINGYVVNSRTCLKSDKQFILNLFKDSIFIYVSEYYVPDINMFNNRFNSDYKERRILLIGKRRIGSFQLTEKDNSLYVTGLFLTKTYQGKGIAKYLMNYFETVAKNNNYSKIKLHVWNNNPARFFYKKLGYKIISKKNHKYLMQKEIKNN